MHFKFDVPLTLSAALFFAIATFEAIRDAPDSDIVIATAFLVSNIFLCSARIVGAIERRK